jgi:Family of unknown function (DUF5681)
MPFPNPATQFRPGVSDNPNGRPRDALTPLLREALGRVGDDGRTLAEQLAEVLIREALGGSFKAMKTILERTEGRPAVSVAVGLTPPRPTPEDMKAMLRQRQRGTAVPSLATLTRPDPAAPQHCPGPLGAPPRDPAGPSTDRPTLGPATPWPPCSGPSTLRDRLVIPPAPRIRHDGPVDQLADRRCPVPFGELIDRRFPCVRRPNHRDRLADPFRRLRFPPRPRPLAPMRFRFRLAARCLWHGLNRWYQGRGDGPAPCGVVPSPFYANG